MEGVFFSIILVLDEYLIVEAPISDTQRAIVPTPRIAADHAIARH
jgi:hypothetical protein